MAYNRSATRMTFGLFACWRPLGRVTVGGAPRRRPGHRAAVARSVSGDAPVTSRNRLATGPGDGVDGSPLHRGPDVAAGRRRLLVVATVVALVAAGALLGGVYLVARGQYDAVYAATYEELEAIGELREDQVAAWEGERLSDALGTVESPFFADAVTRLLADPDDASIRRLIIQQLDLALEADQSENVLLVDLDGRLLATARASHAIVPPATRALIDSVAAPGGSARSASGSRGTSPRSASCRPRGRWTRRFSPRCEPS